MPGSDHRTRLIYAAITLFRRQGYAATGLAQILASSRAPKGSLYHYFPGGKEELGAAAVEAAGAFVAATLQRLADESVSFADFLSKYLHLLAGWLEESDFADGCPVATTLLECVPSSEAISAAGNRVLGQWIDIIASVLAREGDPHPGRRARGVLAAAEGALLLARVQRSSTPILELQTVLR